MNLRRIAARSLLAVTIVALIGSEGRAQAIDTTLWVTNGSVNAVVHDAGTIYLGGHFDRVGPATGAGVPIDLATGALPLSFPKVAGEVHAAVSDGAGGWYIGGLFTAVGGVPRSNIAHVASDLSVTAWNPNASYVVRGLALSGSTVYACGGFTSIGGQSRLFIAALDAVTGAATAWNPNANNDTQAIAVFGSTVYAGGVFTSIGGQPRNRIAALDAVTGAATSWNPNANSHVLVLAVSDSVVYAAGTFSSIGGQTRNGLAALDATTGAATAWNPGAASVWAFALRDSTVYVGGYFNSLGGQPRRNIAALNARTGAATSWNPDAWNPDASGTVLSLAVSGGIVYAGGSFSSIGGQSRNNIAALDATTGAATLWNPDAVGFVRALAVSGSRVYAGGDITTFGGVTRNNIAAFDAVTGDVTPWNPNADFTVSSLAVSGSTVYAGGNFTNIGGQKRSHVAAINVMTAAVTGWIPNANEDVQALAVSGSTVYAGGLFTSIGGQARNYVAALDATSGAATGWNPNASNRVRSLVVRGAAVYVGGDFTTIAGQTRNRVAALDTSGALTAWNPNSNSSVSALVVSDSTVYAGGGFTTIGGQTRNYVAALRATTGAVTAWNPNAGSIVTALALNGSTLYAGGAFTTVGGQARGSLAAIDVTTGLTTAWNPSTSGNNTTVYALAIGDFTVYAGGIFNSIEGLPQASVAAIVAEPSLQAAFPARGGNAGALAIALHGRSLQPGATIRLTHAGQPDIPGTGVIVSADGRSLIATFDLTGALPGSWSVALVNPDLQAATLANGFAIELPLPRLVHVDVVGSALTRPNGRRAYDVVIENPGNTDERAVPLWISRIPLDATIELDFALSPPPQSGGEPDWSTVPQTLEGPGGKYLAVVIPRVSPGVTVRRIYVTVPNTVSAFQLDAAVTPPWANDALLRGCLSGGGVITAPTCMGAQLAALNTYLSTTPGIEALSGIGLWAKIAWQCEGAASLPAALAKAEQVMDFLLQPIEHTGVPSGCEVSLTPRWQHTLAVTVVTSLDPNDKLGASGRGPAREIGAGQILPYSIRFENTEAATAPAQSIVVTDVLDATKLDLATVSLGPMKFGRRANGKPWTVDPGSGLKSYATDMDLRPERDLIVRVSANLDEATGVLGWSLTALDPATLDLPDDPMVGLLPPNVIPGEGEGSLLFTVSPKPGLAGGAEIRNRATITFDGNALLTPDWSNTMDVTPPESAVQPLAATQDSASFTVRWQAIGSPPDLKNFSVYVSKGGEPYRPWRVQTTATADTFAGTGGTYSFYSLAQDSSGNLEAVPMVPDVQTLARLGVAGPAAPALALEGALPNPATSEARVWFTLPSREPAVLEVMDVAGRRLLRREVGAMGPGRHSADVSAATRRPGLYFLRLAQGDRVLRARMVAIR